MNAPWHRRAVLHGKAEWLDVLDRHCGVGLWDAILHDGDDMHPDSRWTWSAEFRRLCGFHDAGISADQLTSVAAAVEEMTSSVAEISRQVATAAQVARDAVGRADTSQTKIKGLGEATARIGDVVRLISDIAGQTNLVALNATIEAARMPARALRSLQAR